MSSDRCPACPCPAKGECLGTTSHPQFCEWAVSGEPAKVATVVNRSALGPEPPLPGLLARAANFAGAAVTHAAAGMPTLGPEAVAARLAVCESCPMFRRSDRACAACGCGLSVKATWTDQRCPRNLWPE